MSTPPNKRSIESLLTSDQSLSATVSLYDDTYYFECLLQDPDMNLQAVHDYFMNMSVTTLHSFKRKILDKPKERDFFKLVYPTQCATLSYCITREQSNHQASSEGRDSNQNQPGSAKKQRISNLPQNNYDLFSMHNLSTVIPEGSGNQLNHFQCPSDDESDDSGILSCFLNGECSLEMLNNNYTTKSTTIKVKRDINSNTDNPIKTLAMNHILTTPPPSKNPRSKTVKKANPNSSPPTSDTASQQSSSTTNNGLVSQNLRDYIVSRDSLANWTEIDIGDKPFLDWKHLYKPQEQNSDAPSYQTSPIYQLLHQYTQFPDQITPHNYQSCYYNNKLDTFTKIFKCVDPTHQEGECAHWTKLHGTPSKTDPEKLEFKCYFINKHYPTEGESSYVNPADLKFSLAAKKYMHTYEMIYWKPSEVLMQMKKDKKSLDPRKLALMNFHIPDVDQIRSYQKRQKKKDRRLLTDRNYESLKAFVKSKLVTSIEEAVTRKYDSDGEIIIVDQWDIEYKVTTKNQNTGIVQTRMEKSIGFAYISYKFLKTYQYIFDNELETSRSGVCLSIDFVHNLFTNKLVQGTIGLPILAPFGNIISIIIKTYSRIYYIAKQNDAASYKRNLNPLIVNATTAPRNKFIPMLSCIFKSENHVDIQRCFRLINQIYFRISGVPKLNVRYLVCDHSDAIALAIKNVYPHALILSCWFHVMQGAKKNSKRIKNKVKDYKKQQLRARQDTIKQSTLLNSSTSNPRVIEYIKSTAAINLPDNCEDTDSNCSSDSDNNDREISSDEEENQATNPIFSQSSGTTTATDLTLLHNLEEEGDSDLEEEVIVLVDNSNAPLSKKNKTFFHTVAKIMIQILHKCPTIYHFDRLASRVVAIWKALREEKFAEWFEGEYLIGHWRLWFFNAGPPGLPTTNNSIECFNYKSLKQHLRHGYKQSLQQALSANGYIQHSLEYIDSYNTIDKVVFFPPNLSQFGKVVFCAIPNSVIIRACQILVPGVQQLLESHISNINNPNIEAITNNDLINATLRNINLPQYIGQCDSCFVVNGNPNQRLTKDIAIAYLETLYPDNNGDIEQIDDIEDSLTNFANFVKKYQNVHLIVKIINPEYEKEQELRVDNATLKNYFSDRKNISKLYYRQVYAETLFSPSDLKKATENNIFSSENEEIYGHIVNINNQNLKIDISLSSTTKTKTLAMDKIIPLLIPHQKYEYICNCAYYKKTTYYCKHILAVWGLREEKIYKTLPIGLSLQTDSTNAAAKIGRPSKAEKACQYRKTYNGFIILKDKRQNQPSSTQA